MIFVTPEVMFCLLRMSCFAVLFQADMQPLSFFFFPEEEVSGAALLALNDRMVQQLVKKIGHQAVLMDLIKKYKQRSQGLESPGSPRTPALAIQAAAAPE